MNPAAPVVPKYEHEDAHPRLIGIVAAIVAAMIFTSLIVVAVLYRFSFSKDLSHPRQTSFTRAADYRTSIAAEWPALDREDDVHLHSYGWIDRTHGVVRIPIDRAMDRLVQESPPTPEP